MSGYTPNHYAQERSPLLEELRILPSELDWASAKMDRIWEITEAELRDTQQFGKNILTNSFNPTYETPEKPQPANIPTQETGISTTVEQGKPATEEDAITQAMQRVVAAHTNAQVPYIADDVAGHIEQLTNLK